MKITLDERPMLNIRQIRSQEITHLIMHALRDFIPDDRLSRANDELHKLLHDIGAEIITDQKRAEIGLPPRGPDGWTVEELKTLEIKRLRSLLDACGIDILPGLNTVVSSEQNRMSEDRNNARSAAKRELA